MINEITIIGPGLIGASLGLAIKKKKIAKRIIGIDTNKSNLSYALKKGSIDLGFNKIDYRINNSDIFFLCTPVQSFIPIIESLIPFLKKDSIISDVGSVKSIFKKNTINKIKKKSDLVPGHPIAGTEFSGAKNSKSDLFLNKWCILTPEHCMPKNLKTIKKIWERIGMKVSVMSSSEHDKLMSLTSHLPHLIAFTIVGTAFKFNQKEKNRLLNFSAGGFRDFTRIAASDPTMWRDIFITNKNNILNTLKEFTKDLEAFRKLIEFEDEKEIFNFIKKTKFVRKKIVKLNQP